MARIARVEFLMIDLKPKVKRVDAIQSFVSQETPIVRITDADGAVGTGYSYTIGTGGPSVMQLIQRTLAPAILNREAEEIERIWRDLLFLTHATTVGAITAIAMAAIDTALWDLRCRRAGLPLHRLAGGAQASVPLYTTEGGWLHLPTEALVEDALRAKAEGFGGAKLKVGRPVHEDVARIAAVRDAVGPGFEIFTDANQAFAVDQAIRRARHYEALDIGWLEEPLPADDIDGHVRLSEATSLPIAVGESLYSISHFREYLQRRACSLVQVDVGRIGGITPWLKAAHMAECFNVAVCPHFLMELHVSLCAAVPNARWVEYIPQLDAITTSGMRIEAGRAVPSEEPGLGIAWDFAEIERRKVDGSGFVAA
ncbi:mandelate racemase/muconate lactonizing enzyme family protein [Labrys wisconsinensis]|uniref:L-alanine-DL-glutamate epimerase-like enolase superfamily enzyme n=1 Tax=Labrys wisconsinensis TaxID=425677 RepID=A0ABU0JE01_9HYPH|nr:mandelate racemase/muconate lactonizing enzyme family protein [Labrys wisconsinensis]MDQ0471840.1 L-alanine-DL-glutamate epimerase-like enolase superfamily enzyme [Labrys wisconsinensis]